MLQFSNKYVPSIYLQKIPCLLGVVKIMWDIYPLSDHPHWLWDLLPIATLVPGKSDASPVPSLLYATTRPLSGRPAPPFTSLDVVVFNDSTQWSSSESLQIHRRKPVPPVLLPLRQAEKDLPRCQKFFNQLYKPKFVI